MRAKILGSLLSLVGLILLATTSTRAEEPAGGQGDGPADHPGMRHRFLKRFDTDGDHKLSDEERAAAKEARKACREKRHEMLLKKFDTNHDGKLDDAERAAAKEAVKERMEKPRAKMLEKFDTNKDGKLDEAERAAAKEAFIKKYDTNGDGKLDEAERAAAREARKARHQGENATKVTTEPAPSPIK